MLAIQLHRLRNRGSKAGLPWIPIAAALSAALCGIGALLLL